MERHAPIAAGQEGVVKAGVKRARLESDAALVAAAQMAQQGVSGVLEPQWWRPDSKRGSSSR